MTDDELTEAFEREIRELGYASGAAFEEDTVQHLRDLARVAAPQVGALLWTLIVDGRLTVDELLAAVRGDP